MTLLWKMLIAEITTVNYLLKNCYVLAIKRLWDDNNRIDAGDDSEILGKQNL